LKGNDLLYMNFVVKY